MKVSILKNSSLSNKSQFSTQQNFHNRFHVYKIFADSSHILLY